MNSQHEQQPRQSKAFTPKKGHATPRRKEAAKHPGTFSAKYAPAKSWGESRREQKALKASMTPEEWKAHKKAQKQARIERQTAARRAMDDGDERYLLERDKGPERAYIRDIVDAKRHLLSFMMPFALFLLVTMIATSALPQVANIISIIAMAILMAFVLEAIMLGRKASQMVREKFPHTTQSGTSIGFYAFNRATQPRRWRSPKPRVELGAKV